MSNNPFDIGIPSIFVICSPFQALCAIEAIHEFKITEYKFILCLGNDVRNQQVFNLMEKYRLPYVVEWMQNRKLKKEFFSAVKPTKSTYHRAFIGDIDSYVLSFLAAKHLGYHSNIVYIDDGTRVIPYLTGRFKANIFSKNNIMLKCIFALKRIKDKQHFFTLFGDIALSKFCCRINYFNHLKLCLKNNTTGNDIYVIGTNIDVYCQKLNLDINKYKLFLKELFNFLKKSYLNNNIIYIQHGRDNNSFVKELCDAFKINCVKPEITVELLIMELNAPPKAIYAYTSTALFNLKKLYPNVSIYNILPEKTESYFYGIYSEYSNYFEKHGIINLQQSDLRI